MKNEDIQQAIVLYQVLQQHAQGLEQQITAYSQRQFEMQSSKEAITDLEKAKANNEILVTLGSGFYVTGSVKDKTSLHTTIGAGYVTKKPVKDAIALIETQLKTVDEFLEKANAEFEQTTTKIQEMTPVIQMALQTMQKE
ncbi:MAG: prefoldin subunit alpha [Nanoarchaeota archaeon]|nr:prefoldin subunit alpha [Nanoarchaeota archaeon]